jgi:hypothetical protein
MPQKLKICDVGCRNYYNYDLFSLRKFPESKTFLPLLCCQTFAKMKLYHGSTTGVELPDLKKCRPTTEFGQAFSPRLHFLSKISSQSRSH